MKAFVVYDSLYGNTAKVAEEIGKVIEATVVLCKDVNPADLEHADLVIFGSPTHGGRPSEGIHALFDAIQSLKGVEVAVFDTRVRMPLFGYAAPRMAKLAKSLGGHLIVYPEGFYVLGTEGPLKVGEIENARQWAYGIAHLMPLSHAQPRG